MEKECSRLHIKFDVSQLRAGQDTLDFGIIEVFDAVPDYRDIDPSNNKGNLLFILFAK